MNIMTNEVVRNMTSEDEASGHFERIPKEYSNAAEILLKDQDRAIADKTTQEGRALLGFAEKAKSKRRRKNKIARRSRRKTRSR